MGIVVGVTGGVATGKSLVAQMFRERGATVFSADEAARAVLTVGGATLREIVQTFGADYLRPDGTLDRARLGARIFADPDARLRLNRIMHPPILRLLRAQIEGAQDDLPRLPIVLEVPLLFEAKMQDWFELIVVVAASESTQIARLRARNGVSGEEARRRLAAQTPLSEKIAQAHRVLYNDGSREALETQVEALWQEWNPPKVEKADEIASA